jgi:hypothetical protein
MSRSQNIERHVPTQYKVIICTVIFKKLKDWQDE